jgi:hypothetical protein
MAIADDLIAIKKPQAFSRCGPGVQKSIGTEKVDPPQPR